MNVSNLLFGCPRAWRQHPQHPSILSRLSSRRRDGKQRPRWLLPGPVQLGSKDATIW